jgi:alkanesulfonate monooxygenase SsuD/methylene tetrahydromethanopterin reductase-like flavin-dependent oxidoreductase (luciferase family)
MRLGISLPQFGSDADDAPRIGEFAAAAERAGAASLWAADRLLVARTPSVGYGGRGDTVPAELRRALDPFVVMGLAAAATSTATLGVSVLIGPLYPAAVLGRSLMTVAAVAGGRMVAGMGIGWAPEEYAAANVPFDHRGARLDTLLDGLDELWSPDGPALVQIPDPRPPLYLSAYAPGALARLGRRADGWLPATQVGSNYDHVGATLRAARATIDEAATAEGRDPAAIESVLRVNVPATATLDDLTVAVRDLAAATGIEHLFVDLMYWHKSFDERLAVLEHLLAAA